MHQYALFNCFLFFVLSHYVTMCFLVATGVSNSLRPSSDDETTATSSPRESRLGMPRFFGGGGDFDTPTDMFQKDLR